MAYDNAHHRSSAAVTSSVIKGCCSQHINISAEIKTQQLFLRSPEVCRHCFDLRSEEQALQYEKHRKIKISNSSQGK